MKNKHFILVITQIITLMLLTITFSKPVDASLDEPTYTRYDFKDNGENYSITVNDDYKSIIDTAKVIIDGVDHPIDINEAVSVNSEIIQNTPSTRVNVNNGTSFQRRYYVYKNTVTYGYATANINTNMLFSIFDSKGNTIISTRGTGKRLELAGIRLFYTDTYAWAVKNLSSSTRNLNVYASF